MTDATPKPRVLIAEPLDFAEQAIAILNQAATADLRAVDRFDLRAAFQEYDVVWIRLANRITAEVLGPRPRTRVLVSPTTGLDHIDLDACRERGIRVVSLQGEFEFLKNVRATAEMTLALTLALLRRLPAAVHSVSSGDWNRDRFRGGEVFDKTVGIVGVGRLGTIVARYFRTLGAEVIGYDPRPDFPYEVARRVDRLPELLAQSDIVCILMKYDETTRHLFAAAEFAAMKEGAVLVNTSRGGVIDEKALLAALERGKPAAAALDVLEGEPNITAEHPLVAYARTHENVLITPHIGGNTLESLQKAETFLAGRVVAALDALSPKVVES
jgi:D-3-phosphoglycerate dehydrogenase